MAKMSDDEDYDISDADSTADYDAAKSDAESSGPEEYEESGSEDDDDDGSVGGFSDDSADIAQGSDGNADTLKIKQNEFKIAQTTFSCTFHYINYLLRALWLNFFGAPCITTFQRQRSEGSW